MTEKQTVNQLSVLSFGAGQDSTSILLKLIFDPKFRRKYAPNDLVVIMSDTGNEHPETYEHMEYMQSLCKLTGVPFIFISNDLGYHTGKWQTLDGFYEETTTCGSKVFRKTCTDNLKIRPIYKCLENYLGEKYGVDIGRKKGFYLFTEKHGKIRMMIGIAADEVKRAKKSSPNDPKWKTVSIEMSYPLIDIDWGRKECQEYIKASGIKIPLPSNCMMCPYIREIELLWLYRVYPKVYYKWVKIEKNKLDRFAKELEKNGSQNHGVFPCRKGKTITLVDVLEETKEKYGHWNNKQLWDYRMSHGHCVASKY